MKKIAQKYLAFLARHTLSRFRPYIIGITGSSGKTTTRHFVYELLSSVNPSVGSSQESLNTEIGLPLAILGFQKAPVDSWGWLLLLLYAPFKTFFTFSYYKFLVLEYGADKPGDISELVSIARPDISIITSIADAHIGQFGSRDNIIKEKWKLAIAAKDAIVVNKAVIDQINDKLRGLAQAKLYILPSIKNVKAENIEAQTNKTKFDLYIANRKYPCEFKFFGKHNIQNLELAVYSVHLVAAEDREIARAIKDLSLLEGRGDRFITDNEILVLDESYNANPASMRAALENLKNINYGRKVAVLGQMSEIDPISKQAHEEIAGIAKKISDYTVGVGEGFSNLGLDRWYKDVSELIEEASSFLRKGDVVLVKGSRWANRLDKFIKYLKSND